MGWMGANEFLASDLEYQSTLEEDAPIKRKLPFPEWHLQANCWDMEESAFFGASDTTQRPALSMSGVNRAKNVCNACPVLETCLRKALGVGDDSQREEYGIWAGTSGRTRRRIWDLVDTGVVSMERVVSDIVSGKEAKYEREVTIIESSIQIVPLRNVG